METTFAEDGICKACKGILSIFLINSDLEYHVMCAPDDVFKVWAERFRI